MKLMDILVQARLQHRAIAHFNVASIDMLHACTDALDIVTQSRRENIPMVIGFAEGERDWMGEETAVTLVRYEAEARALPIFVNADHTYSLDRAKQAIDAGYDCVVVDGANLSYEENVALVQSAVVYRNTHNPDCLIEAELGYIGAGSTVRDELPQGVSAQTMTTVELAQQFIADTGCDLLAPSVGNVHGMVRGGNPALDAQRVVAIAQAIPTTPLILHGGSGSSDADFRAVIESGISMIHISTELRVAYRNALEQSLRDIPDMAPYKYLKPSYEAVRQVAENRIRLFWGV